MNTATLASRRAMRGLSLVELMVSLVIGLILMVAVVSAYLGSASASRMAEAQGRMNEDGQAALAVISQHIRMAGNNPVQPNYPSTTYASQRNPAFGTGTIMLRGCDATFSDLTTQTDPAALTCPSTATATDSFVVRYEADEFNTVKSAPASVVPTDCLGQNIPASTANVSRWNGTAPVASNMVTIPAVTYYVADNRFYIANVGSIPNLYCLGNGSTSGQPLVENIEAMQVLYGTAAATGAVLDVRGYLTAANVEALVTVPLNTSTRWSRVMTARVCVVVRSELPVAPDLSSAKYNDCTGTLQSATDLRLRRAFTTTVVLRNRVPPA